MEGNWRILRNEQLYNSYCPPNVFGGLKYCAGEAGVGDRRGMWHVRL